MSKAICVENISKQYRLGKVGTGTFAHDLNMWWHSIRGKENPYLRIGEVNDRTQKGDSDYVWALKDINFSIEQGDVVGIIGRNGAGKSTLLKLLSKTTSPTTGNIKIKGRIASLLEVGTGFHPDLSGRENIFLNGAILGMTKKEIKRKFDEIVDFAGVERYIDTPVKRYSSGMYVRLAFGVAAHLESEILIVDEVLAVGDSEFQKKALGKMQSISSGDGRTVLFVSHNMGAMRRLCKKGIYLANGTLNMTGEMGQVITHYLNNSKASNLSYEIEKDYDKPVFIYKIWIEYGRTSSDLIDVKDQIKIHLNYLVNYPTNKHSIAIRLKKDETIISQNFIEADGDIIVDKRKGAFEAVTVNFPIGLFKAGRYSLDVSCGVLRTTPIQFIENAINFEIELLSGNEYSSAYSSSRAGIIVMDLKWNNNQIDAFR